MCGQQYFLSYVLGIPDTGNKKAEKGTIVHKVMESLSRGKKAEQENESTFTDDVLGLVDIDLWNEDWMDWLTRQSFDYYTSKSVHDFSAFDYKECRKWVQKTVDYNDGMMDPRNHNVIDAEPHFDITIEEPWAEYDYIMPDGERLHGYLSIKGTIDLIANPKDNLYESIDWKTGLRKDWATGKEKDFNSLCVDPQLRIYHLAMSYMYPEVEQFVPTIFFINHGGPFTMAYGPEDIEATKKMLAHRFEEIKKVTRPQLITGYDRWKCNKFCYYGITQHPSGNINPRTGEPHTICSYMAEKTKTYGIDIVMQEDTAKGHYIDYYQDPGV